jgi:hypothetical protein
MKTIRELLQVADPLQQEPAGPAERRERVRQAILAAAARNGSSAGMGARPRIAVFAAIALAAVAASFFGSRGWSSFVGELQAAVRFEVRLAEEGPEPGLRKATVAGGQRSIYLHDEVIVDNSDIAVARVVPSGVPSQYAIDVEFNASGADKMRAATGTHIGKPVAVLLDGEVVMIPVIRAPIGGSATITGNFTRTQAERIVNGIGIP